MVNLIHAFEFYLLGAFLLGALQIRTYIALMRFVLAVPGRWPELYQILRANINVLLTWPIVLVTGFAGGLWTAQVLLRRLVWPQASVTWADLATDTAWLATVAFFGALMVILDGWALLRVARFRPPRMQWLLTLTDVGLRNSKIGTPLRILVGWHVRTKLLRRLPILIQWTLRRTAENAARLAFGLSLWVGWAWRAAG